MDVRQLSLEPLQPPVEAVVEHNGDGHAAQEHHEQDAGQSTLDRNGVHRVLTEYATTVTTATCT